MTSIFVKLERKREKRREGREILIWERNQTRERAEEHWQRLTSEESGGKRRGGWGEGGARVDQDVEGRTDTTRFNENAPVFRCSSFYSFVFSCSISQCIKSIQVFEAYLKTHSSECYSKVLYRFKSYDQNKTQQLLSITKVSRFH